MKLPTDTELRDGFNEFANFTFDLLDKVESDSKYLKFSAINSQISLELFLKFWFVKNGRLHDIQRVKNGKRLNNFISFSDILHLFYSSKTWSYGEKKEFVKLKSKTINLGLDLQGGMHVVLEVDIKELLSQIAKNKNDLLTKTLDKTANEVLESDEDFIAVLNRNLTLGGNKILPALIP